MAITPLHIETMTAKRMATAEQALTLRKGSTDKGGCDADTLVGPDPVYGLRNRVYPRGFVCIQSGKIRLNGLENLFLWVQLRQWGCIWTGGARENAKRWLWPRNALSLS